MVPGFSCFKTSCGPAHATHKLYFLLLSTVLYRRRMERLQQRQTELPFTNGKPTPDHIITSLPVMSYANLLNQLGLGVLPTAAAAAQQPTQQQQFASALQAAMFAGCLNSSTTAPTSYPPQPQATPQTAPTAAPGLCNFGLLNPTQQGLKRGLSTSQSAGSLHTSSSCSDLPRQQSAQSTDKDCCPICFSDYEACSQVKQLPCRHYYHSGACDCEPRSGGDDHAAAGICGLLHLAIAPRDSCPKT